MASATGIPEALPGRTAEEEPLLGHAGVASQAEGRPMYENLWLGECALQPARDSC